jgi:predicted DNA-binding protein (MmcQ/YjbR family)
MRAMNNDSIRAHCLDLPHTTEMVQWGDDLLFKVGGKMFAVMGLEPHHVVLSFKATPEQFYELQEREGVIPAPYMARNQWLALERFDAVRDDELKELLATSYRLVYEKLPKRIQEELSGKTAKRKTAKRNAKAKSGKQKAERKAPKSGKAEKGKRTAHKRG